MPQRLIVQYGWEQINNKKQQEPSSIAYPSKIYLLYQGSFQPAIRLPDSGLEI